MDLIKKWILQFLVGGKVSVRDANKYLDRVVLELKLKHEKISHEDFDNDLESITGIRWKQVKNYKNHPKPGQEIQDNSKVKQFIFEQRRKDKFHIAKRAGILVASLVLGVLVVSNVFSPKESVTIVKVLPSGKVASITNTKIAFSVPELAAKIRLGMDKKSLGTTNCHTVQTSDELCAFEFSEKEKGRISFYLMNDVLLRTTLMTENKKTYDSIYNSLKPVLEGFKQSKGFYVKELETTNYQKGSERIVFSAPGPLMPKGASPLVYMIELSFEK